MYRWPWLERTLRSHPWAGVTILVVLLALCAWIVVSAPHDRSPRSGLPMWLFAVMGIALFGYALFRYVRLIASRHKDEED